MNIAIVACEYPPGKGVGGTGTYTYNLAHGLACLGHDVHVVCHTDPEDGEESTYKEDSVKVHRIREPKWTQRFSPLKVFWYRWRIRQEIFRIHRDVGLDIVECPNSIFLGLFLEILPKKFPVVVRVHTPIFEQFVSTNGNPSLRFRFLSWLEKMVVIMADGLVVATKFYAEKIENEYGLKSGSFTIVPLGVDLTDEKELNFSPGNTKVEIIFVGRLEERKGIRYLLDAIPGVIRSCPGARFKIYGKDLGGFKENFLKKSGGRFDGSVEFYGYVRDEELKSAYRNCDIFVAPSLSESFGLVFVEAMGWAKPVVACDVCAVGEIVENGKSGVLVKPRDAEALAQALIELVKDREKREAMGRYGRQLAEKKFSAGRMAVEMERFYCRVKQG